MGQGILDPLIRNVRKSFPLGPSGEVTELNLVTFNVTEFRLEVIVLSDQLCRITDIIVPLVKKVDPVIKRVDPGFFN